MASLRPSRVLLGSPGSRRAATRPSPRHSNNHALPFSLRAPSFLRRHSTSSVSASELTHFSALASSWWDPMGPSRILHLMNPLRHEFIASCLADGSPETDAPSNSATLHYLDVGCGGGIFAESLARTIPLNRTDPPTPSRAASITAIDPSTQLIQIARDHARTDPAVDAHLRSGRFRYLNTTLEEVLSPSTSSSSTSTTTSSASSSTISPSSPTEKTPRYDIVTLFEVLEHVDPTTSSPQTFLKNCLRALKPGGWLIGSTIARTVPSFLLNQVIAEAPWPIGVVPRGTHEWTKFVNPPEVHAWVQEGLMRAADEGVTRGGPRDLEGMAWKCVGVVYVPGLGWKVVPGAEEWGNYFWAVRKGI